VYASNFAVLTRMRSKVAAYPGQVELRARPSADATFERRQSLRHRRHPQYQIL
jgi:hypothetical protein